MSKIYETISLQEKVPVRLCERAYGGLRYVVQKRVGSSWITKYETDAMCYAYKAYNEQAAL